MIVHSIANQSARIEPAGNRFHTSVAEPHPPIPQDGMQLSMYGEREFSLYSNRANFLSSDSPASTQEVVEPVDSMDTRIQFTRDSESGRLAIAVIDSATQEVLREIPSQEVLDVLNRLSHSREHFFQLLS